MQKTILFLFLPYILICPYIQAEQVNLLVNLFSKLYISFIPQWIVFIFGRVEEEEDQ